MANKRLAGKIYVKTSAGTIDVTGSWTYNLGVAKREPITGADMSTLGFKETPVTPYIQGTIADSPDLDLQALLETEGETVTLELANGKQVVLRDAWYAGDADADTGEGTIPVRFEGTSAKEVK